MIIPLKITQDKITVIATVRYKRFFGYVEFYIDTGSGESFISCNDAIKLQIPPTSLPLKRHAKIGGGSIALNIMENVLLTFKNEKGEPEKINNPEFLVACNLRKEDTTAKNIPSIIGLSFLLEHKFSLHVNPSNNEACLERNNT